MPFGRLFLEKSFAVSSDFIDRVWTCCASPPASINAQFTACEAAPATARFVHLTAGVTYPVGPQPAIVVARSFAHRLMSSRVPSAQMLSQPSREAFAQAVVSNRRMGSLILHG
jgi:hypothetical protein